MKKFYSLVILILFYQLAFAQNSSENLERYYHRSPESLSRSFNGDNQESSTGQSGTGGNMDVVYHRIWWRINPDSATKGITGVITTYFKTTSANVSTITFDLRKTAFDNANLVVTYHGTGCTKTVSAANVLSITLPSTIVASNTLDSVTISYAGVPPAVSGAAEGYQKATTPAGQNYIYTLSESYEDRDWWPCKADMQDKIDSMDIIVNTPWTGADTFWVATNGKLVDSTINGNSRTFTFQNRYPMASYLVCVSVARYNRYYRGTVNVGGIDVPIVYYLFRGKTAAQYTAILTSMDYMTQMVTAYSNKFGYYPYAREKHGFYEGLGGAGGMEHQTFSAIASASLNSRQTLAHELMHQWFGDKATFATWADLWLAEGFARYGEVLAGELVPATGIVALNELTAARTAARGNTTTPTRITSFGNSAQVWGGSNVSAVYDRGCMVVSMLRALSGDTKFFQACTNYLDSTNGSGYKSANSDSLKTNFNRVLGTDLTAFFDDFVTGTGHPTYTINWQPIAAGGIYVSIGAQSKSAGSSVAYFNTPIVLRVQAPGKDTTIVFYDLTDGNFTTGNLAKAGNGIEAPIGGNRLNFPLSFVPTTVTFDPGLKTIAGGTVLQVSTLDLKILDFSVRQSNTGNEALLLLDGNATNSEVVLQRSINGIDFTELGIMTEQSGTQSGKKYGFKDVQPSKANNFYRARFKNAEGYLQYSRIIKLTGSMDHGYSVVKNPIVNGQLVINSKVVTANSTVSFSIYDAAGKMLTKEIKNGMNQNMMIDVSKFLKGTYSIKISGDEQTSLRFVIQ